MFSYRSDLPALYIKASEIIIDVIITHPPSRVHFSLTLNPPSELLLSRATELQSATIAVVRSKAQSCLDYDWLSVSSVKLMSEDRLTFSPLLRDVFLEVFDLIE